MFKISFFADSETEVSEHTQKYIRLEVCSMTMCSMLEASKGMVAMSIMKRIHPTTTCGSSSGCKEFHLVLPRPHK
jgi:hypothetical protein